MPTLHLLCGLPGSGKTTFARDLAARSAVVVLSADEWMARLFGPEHAGNDDARARVRTLQTDVARQALRAGADVVLDWGLWFRSERDEMRAFGQSLGATVETWFFDTPMEEVRRRLCERNARPDSLTFEVTVEQIDAWSRVFEPPSTEEAVCVVRPE